MFRAMRKLLAEGYHIEVYRRGAKRCWQAVQHVDYEQHKSAALRAGYTLETTIQPHKK